MFKNSLLITVSSLLLSACNEDNLNQFQNKAQNGSNIPYLKDNHASYRDTNNIAFEPYAIELNGDQLYWDIYAETEEQASTLKDHIEFMGDKLDQGAYPRSWDKLFILEAEMHAMIHTEITLNGQQVTINKTADNPCALLVMKTHAEAVSQEFFKNGDTSVDHASIADDIINSIECSEYKAQFEEAISTQLSSKPGSV